MGLSRRFIHGWHEFVYWLIAVFAIVIYIDHTFLHKIPWSQELAVGLEHGGYHVLIVIFLLAVIHHLHELQAGAKRDIGTISTSLAVLNSSEPFNRTTKLKDYESFLRHAIARVNEAKESLRLVHFQTRIDVSALPTLNEYYAAVNDWCAAHPSKLVTRIVSQPSASAASDMEKWITRMRKDAKDIPNLKLKEFQWDGYSPSFILIIIDEREVLMAFLAPGARTAELQALYVRSNEFAGFITNTHFRYLDEKSEEHEDAKSS